MVADTSSNNHDYFRNNETAGTLPLVQSVYAKANGYNYAVFKSGNNSNGANFVIVVNLTDGTITQTWSSGGGTPSGLSYGVQYVGNGWYRLWIIHSGTTTAWGCVAPSPTGTPSFDIYGNPVYTGDGTSGVLFWGNQVESGILTSYIPTTGSSNTRAADQLSFTIPSGATSLQFTFDDNSTQTVSVSPGAYTVDPTTITRPNVKYIDWS